MNIIDEGKKYYDGEPLRNVVIAFKLAKDGVQRASALASIRGRKYVDKIDCVFKLEDEILAAGLARKERRADELRESQGIIYNNLTPSF
jgi:hypothetical protein